MIRQDAEVEGAREHAFTLDPRSLPWLEAALPAIARKRGRVAIVGGGPIGVAAAAELSASYPDLRVVLIARGEVLRVCADHLCTPSGTLAFSACLWAVDACRCPLPNREQPAHV